MKKNVEYENEEQTAYKSIRDWREDERPRERLLKHGAQALTDAELLAILISNGTVKCSALDMARNLLDKYSNLTELATKSPNELMQINGIGTAKSASLSAAFELAARVQSEPFSNKKIIRNPEDVANFYIPHLRGLKKEVFRVLLLNSSNQILREEVISEGILNASVVHPREVFRPAITECAASIILLHNHPSGNPEPSAEDKNITKQLVEAGRLIDIKIFDHIIIAGEEFSSFAKMGLI